jgi:muramidase (phage lysozyme)
MPSFGDNAADAFAQAAKDRAETTVALDATNQLQGLKSDLSNPDTGYKSLLGGDAVKGIDGQALAGHYLSLFDQGWKDISSKLMPGPQAMFDAAALNMRDDFANDLIKHEAEQGRVWRQQVLDTTVGNATSALIAGADGNDAGYTAKARAALVADGLGQGLVGEDLAKQTNLAFGRRVVEPVVTARLNQGDVAGAKAFFDLHRDSMAGDDADILDQRLTEAKRFADTRIAVDGVWKRLGPKSLNDPIDLNAIEDGLVVYHGGDEEARMRAHDEVLHRVFGFTQARDETHAGYVNFLIDQVKGGSSPSQIAALPQFLALPKDKQQQLSDWHREQMTDRLGGLTPERNLERMARQFAAYHDLSGDNALKSMSDAQVQALEPVLGENLTKQTVAQKAGMSLDQTDLASLARNLGLDTDPADTLGKAQLGVIRSTADKALAQLGKTLTMQQRREVMFDAAQNAVSGHPLFDDGAGRNGGGAFGQKAYGPTVQVAAGYGPLAASDVDFFNRKAFVAADRDPESTSGGEKKATIDQQVLQILADRVKDPFIHYDPELGTLVQTKFNIDGRITKTPLSPEGIKAFKEKALNAITSVYDAPPPQELELREQIAPGSTAAALKALTSQTPQEKNLAEARANLRDPRVQAFLATIAYAENKGQGTLLQYDSLFGDHPEGRRNRFTDYSKFPGSGGVGFGGGKPTADGRYQINKDTYDEFSRKIGLTDFSPETQDLMATHMLAEKGVIEALRGGDFARAVDQSGRWMSLPRRENGQWVKRRKNQPIVPYEKLQQFYDNWLKEHPGT